MKFYIADCFAQAKYQGNQLAVFVPDCPISDKGMQQIANEMGFSETSFFDSCPAAAFWQGDYLGLPIRQ